MNKNISTILALLMPITIFIGLSACSNEPRELTIHKPGDYKGTTDPLVAKGQHPELNHCFLKV